MKISRIEICGFRGIPPVSPPDVDIDLVRGRDEPQDLLVFGPNAFGKSSIADALEWFFKEHVRGSDYFEGYQDSDNVHLNIGKPNYQPCAYIELDIAHNGQVHTVRKELDDSGVKSGENLTGIEAELEQCKDEIIILDHDQFRSFVSAANKEKWTTFSSLIGYEELDHFRAGVDSLSQRSLTDWLRLGALRTEVNNKQTAWQNDIQTATRECGLDLSDSPLETLARELMGRLGVVLASLDMPIPECADEVDDALWTSLHKKTQAPDSYRQASERLVSLERLSTAINPFEESFLAEIAELLKRAESLAQKKDDFDKELLSEFYAKGLEVIDQGKTSQNQCPFCTTSYDWDMLSGEVAERLAELDFEGIKRESESLVQRWQQLRTQVSSRVQSASNVDLLAVRQAISTLPDDAATQRVLELASFDSEQVEQWGQKCEEFAQALQGESDRIAMARSEIEKEMGENPMAQLASEVEICDRLWRTWLRLKEDWEALKALELKCQVTEEVVDQIREVAGQFRQELNDFSGRVVELINDDVNRYYEALHPADGVQPFLETELVGNQRKVLLKCTYMGTPDKDAASLLSESHRNSLGLALMLAFMKYKRRTGSPVDFLIFDDVTQSFDVGHRFNLINFLEDPAFAEVSQSQVIFLTHDRTLADLIQRPGEQRPNWLRYDIRSWQLNNLHIEPHDLDLLQRANGHLQGGDELAAAIYGRHALEGVYKSIVDKAGVLMPYNPKPWHTKLETFQRRITAEVKQLWSEQMMRGTATIPRGLINPDTIRLDELNRALRVLHLTVHDSDFLDNPPSQPEIRTAIDAVVQLRDLFTCPNCRAQTPAFYQYFHTLAKDNQGNPPRCKHCNEPLPCH